MGWWVECSLYTIKTPSAGEVGQRLFSCIRFVSPRIVRLTVLPGWLFQLPFVENLLYLQCAGFTCTGVIHVCILRACTNDQSV